MKDYSVNFLCGKLLNSTMAQHCALLELPPELRNIIYEYTAVNEQIFHIKRTIRPKHGRRIATVSGLVLANRQISGEFTSVVQAVAVWPGTWIKASVCDFNFRHLEKFISTLSPSDRAILNANGKMEAQFIISGLQNVGPDAISRWLAFCSRRGIGILYSVDDINSEYCYPMSPPRSGDLNLFQRLSSEGDEAEKIYTALKLWQNRCYERRYRLTSSDSSRTAIYVKWYGGFVQFDAEAEDGAYSDLWDLDIDSQLGKEFGDRIPHVDRL